MPTGDTRGTVQLMEGTVTTSVCPHRLKTAGTLGEGNVFSEAVVTDEFIQYGWHT